MSALFWWDIDFWGLIALLFWLFFRFTGWSNFISRLISYQTTSSLCNFCSTLLDPVFAASIPVFVSVSINFLSNLLPKFLQTIRIYILECIFCLLAGLNTSFILDVIYFLLSLYCPTIASCLHYLLFQEVSHFDQ